MQFIYRAMWEISQPIVSRRELIDHASRELVTMAADDGAQLTGPPQWTIAGDRLTCDVPAQPLGLTWPTADGNYIDIVKVDQACDGQPVKLTRGERDEAVARLTAQGLSASDIAQRLGVTERSVQRRRSARAAGVREVRHATRAGVMENLVGGVSHHASAEEEAA